MAATARVVRVLKGDSAPDAVLNLTFSYKPALYETPEMTSRVPAIRALLFLEQREQGCQPLHGAPGLLPMGGFVVPVSRTALVHAPDTSLNARLSREYGLALEELVTEHQTEFSQTGPGPMNGYRLSLAVVRRNQFEALAESLFEVETDSFPVLQSLSQSSLLPLRVLRLTGRLRRGDATVLADVEKDLPWLAGSGEGNRFERGLFRLALADPTLPGFETTLASTLGQMHRLEFLPYAMLLLDSSDGFARAASMMSTCQILQTAQPVLWKAAAMPPHCPDRAPLEDAPREQADIQFWKQWWAARRDEVARLVTLPEPRAPARWSNAPQEEVSAYKSLPWEAQVESLLRQELNRPSHAHDESGAIIKAPQSLSIADSLLQDPADRRLFRHTAKESQRKFEENQTRREDLRNAGRVTGVRPTGEQIMAAFKEWRSATETIIANLRNRLTPEGWKALESYATSPPQ